MKVFFVSVLFLILGSVRLHGAIWINEFHYDNSGADDGEFGEVVVAPDMANVPLGNINLLLYNGSNGETYGAVHSLDTFAVGENISGFTFYSKLISSIQNGPVDGLALDVAGSALEFISYGGTFTATNGAHGGIASTDVGVVESTDTEVGFSLYRTGAFDATASDFGFTWAGPSANTRGALNTAQAVPEPSSFILLGLVASLGFGYELKRRAVKK